MMVKNHIEVEEKGPQNKKSKSRSLQDRKIGQAREKLQIKKLGIGKIQICRLSVIFILKPNLYLLFVSWFSFNSLTTLFLYFTFILFQYQKLFIYMDLVWLGLIIPLSYIAISIFFLCFPNILHKRNKYDYPPFNDLLQSNHIFCIGHRGGGWQGPENTLQLFEQNNQRLHMFQLDVCLTKDKKLVVHHDSTLTRTCGVNKQISQCNYEQLPLFQKQFQSFGGPKLKSNSNKIPLLQQLFEKFPDKPMNIELKYATQQGIAQFNRIVKKYHRQSITVWGIAGSLNEKLRQANPNVVNFYSGGEVFKIFILFLTGLLPFACLRQGVLDVPLYTQDFYKLAMNFTQSKCLKCIIFFVFLILRCFNFFSWFFIRHLKKRGILTFYFILNNQEDYQRAISKGCSGIMSDVTKNLQEYLKRKSVFYQQNCSQSKVSRNG